MKSLRLKYAKTIICILFSVSPLSLLCGKDALGRQSQSDICACLRVGRDAHVVSDVGPPKNISTNDTFRT
jgi:hypothetical protein